MRIGVPKEVKNREYRVGMTPAGVRQCVQNGHTVLVQSGAGMHSGFVDEAYASAGATIVADAKEVWDCDLIVKVKEPVAQEYPLLQKGKTLFCYLHLAPDRPQTEALMKSGITAIAYETVTDHKGRLPLLEPMSEIAGRLSIQIGATYLQLNHGGKGVLLGGVPGVLPANVVVVGGGAAGREAARMAMGLGAQVILLDKDIGRLRQHFTHYAPLLQTLYSTAASLEEAVANADLVVGAVLIPGKKAPPLITREMLRKMAPGGVFVDVSIDQGGIAETSRPTTHDNPVYVEEGITHYCVTNMPGACARTSTLALTNATMSYVLALANEGPLEALRRDPHLREGLNVYGGKVTNQAVAEDLTLEYVSVAEALR